MEACGGALPIQKQRAGEGSIKLQADSTHECDGQAVLQSSDPPQAGRHLGPSVVSDTRVWEKRYGVQGAPVGLLLVG